MTAQPILDWTQRGIGGERAGELWDALVKLMPRVDGDPFEALFDELGDTLVVHRALLRLEVEELLRRADELTPSMVSSRPADEELATVAFEALTRRVADAMGAPPLPRS